MENLTVSYRGKHFRLNDQSVASYTSLVKFDVWLQAGLIFGGVLIITLVSGYFWLRPSEVKKSQPARIELKQEAPGKVEPAAAKIRTI